MGRPSFLGGSWVNMDPKVGGLPHLWGALGQYGPQSWGCPSLMGVSWAHTDPKVGVSHISGGPWVNMDPKFGGVLHLWGVLGPCGPQNSGVPRAPQNSGTSSLFLGCPGPTRTPKLGGPPHLWGARGLQRPRIRGYPFLRGVPCGNLGVPLLCGVSGYLEHPETQGSAWTPKFRGSPLLWGALGPQHPKTWGGGFVCTPKLGGRPL